MAPTCKVTCKVDGIERVFDVSSNCWLGDLRTHLTRLAHIDPEPTRITEIRVEVPVDDPEGMDDIDTIGRQRP